jgi:hypothetical protein
VAPAATPQAVGGASEAVAKRLRRRLIRSIQGAASGVWNVVGLRRDRVTTQWGGGRHYSLADHADGGRDAQLGVNGHGEPGARVEGLDAPLVRHHGDEVTL